MRGKVYVHENKKGEWYWTAIANNGRKIATAGEGFKRKFHAKKMAKDFATRMEYKLIEE